jgi:pimeloyl-ACP methyl ester carboxylesterase
MTLASLALLLAPALPVQDDLVRTDARFSNGDLELAGELIRVGGIESPLPGAVVLQGSGDSDRSNQWSRLIADLLAREGVVVLLTDKRGCGASGGSWLTAGFEDLAGDALAGVAYLRGLEGVDPQRVGLVGLSQGGWVAPIAAARSRDVAFVISVSGAAVGFAEQVSLEMTNTTLQAGLPPAAVDEVIAMGRATSRYALDGNWEAYAAARERGLATPARPVIAGFPDSPDHPQWGFLRRVGTFDPMPYWMAVGQPVLVLYGAKDQDDNVPVTESVRRLEHAFGLTRKANARVVVFRDAGHALLDEGGLIPDFVDTVAEWLQDTVH